jgi:hypothetical protein
MFLSPLSSDLPGTESVRKFNPPLSFRALQGTPRNVNISVTSYTRGHGNSAAKVAGLRYEEKVQKELSSRYMAYTPEPRLTFDQDDGTTRFVKPDGLLIFPEYAVIVEIKISHLPEAWWQLHRLYRPVVEALLKKPVHCLEICRSYDPAVAWPGPVDLCDDLETAVRGGTTPYPLRNTAPPTMVLPWKL